MTEAPSGAYFELKDYIMILILWFVFTFLAMADIGKYHVLPSDLTVLLYGIVSFVLGSLRAHMRTIS
ncbi:hypothetical protein [Salmonella phage FrontPhageNews]|nr:hypothetical protein SP063_00070 [Salmonella phage FSL SP-063]AGF89091.1 hypothetical protein SP029_00545 [Salmonella phage FSL SP-029]QPX73954.1 hypothetical protein [Salmonella phage AR2819]QPX74353.1 hypothetical protein [Salmonella phage FrontPhageNews]